VDVTKASYGLLPDLALTVGGNSTKISQGIVSPYEIAPDDMQPPDAYLYCVDGASNDLQTLRDCKCGGQASACAAFPDTADLDAEACKRLDAVLALHPTQDPRMKPSVCYVPATLDGGQ
jgi:hypothetical protein